MKHEAFVGAGRARPCHAPRAPRPLARAGAIGLLLAMHAAAGLCAQPPDAGQTSQELRRAPVLPAPAPPPSLRIEQPTSGTPAAPAGATIRVTGFRFTGASAFGDAELQALVGGAVGRTLNLAELEREAARVTAYYRAHGYLLARAYLPAQDIAGGVVTIAVLEGRYGRIGIDNKSGVADGILSAPLGGLEPGAAVTAAALERSLLLLAEMPGIELKSTLRPGASVGTSDLLVEALPGKRVSGAVDADNYGNRFTGEHRIGATLNLANPIGRGDLFTLRALTAGGGLDYGRFAYQLPVGGNGTRTGLAWSHMGYELGRDFANLDAHGTARIGSAFVQHPFVRSRAANLYGQLSYEHKRLDDRVDAAAVATQKTLRNWTAAVNGDRRDDWLGGGVTGASLAYVAGDLDIDSPAAAAIDAASARATGHFEKWTFSLTRLQQVSGATSLYFSWSGQLAAKNLDSAEKFSLGGAFGVRAYPQGEAVADEGHLVNLELRHGFGQSWQAVAFGDAAWARIDKEPWAAGTNIRRLKGAGVGLNWADAGWNVKSALAWRLNSPQPLADRERTPRVWIQVARYF